MLTAKIPLGEYLREVVETGIMAKKGENYIVTIQSVSVTKIEAKIVSPDGCGHQIILSAKPNPLGHLYWEAEASPPL